jgi:hypothetical protein
MNQTDLMIYGAIFAVVVVFVWMIRSKLRRIARDEAQSETLTIAQLRASVGSQLLPGPLMWGVWREQLSFKETHLVLRDASSAEVTKIVVPFAPMAGVQQYFELHGMRYESVQEGVVSGRTWLRDAQSGDVVLSCHHGWRSVTFYRGKSDVELCRIDVLRWIGSPLSITQGDVEIGRLITAYECSAQVLSLSAPSLSALEQCFVLLSLPGRRVT